MKQVPAPALTPVSANVVTLNTFCLILKNEVASVLSGIESRDLIHVKTFLNCCWHRELNLPEIMLTSGAWAEGGHVPPVTVGQFFCHDPVGVV